MKIDYYDYLNKLFEEFKNSERELYFIANKEEENIGSGFKFILMKIEDGFDAIVAWEKKESAEKVLADSELDKDLYKVYPVSSEDFDKYMQRLSPERRHRIRIKFAK